MLASGTILVRIMRLLLPFSMDPIGKLVSRGYMYIQQSVRCHRSTPYISVALDIIHAALFKLYLLDCTCMPYYQPHWNNVFLFKFRNKKFNMFLLLRWLSFVALTQSLEQRRH